MNTNILTQLVRSSRPETIVRELLTVAGVEVNGRAAGDIQVKNPRFYERFLRDASIGLGESYMEEWWECDKLDVFIDKVLRADLQKRIRGSWVQKIRTARALLLNMQSRSRAPEVALRHYDLGNDLYEVMLDKRMMYTCGYWKNATTLEAAQEAKLELVCKKVGLKPGMRVLELGCGWGGFANFAAERYGCTVLGVTISKEQARFGQARAAAAKLPVEIRCDDYRNVSGRWDAVVSIGMCEHVGGKNYRTLMEIIARSLKDDAAALVHTIGNNESMAHGVPFIDKYVFPNAVAPSIAQLGKSMEGLLVMEDWHNFGPDYDPTAMAWWQNFDAHYATLDQRRYDRAFYLMWRFYLLGGAGSHRSRESQLWQLVLTRPGARMPDCRVS